MPLIYVIPDSYVGPAVALFNQPDGIEPVQTKDGLEVRVPENGIVKIRGNPKLGHCRLFRRVRWYSNLRNVTDREVLLEAINAWAGLRRE